jgi:hypothetical protein
MGKYQELVEAAKRIMFQIECHQADIAKLALEACEISRGGDPSTQAERYTLKDFANDTGIDHGSLKHWVGVYRDVFLKIDKPSPTKKEWHTGQRVHSAMRSLVDEKTARGRGYKAALPKEDVKNLYDEVLSNPEVSIAADKALKYATLIRATLAKVDLSTQNPQLLSQILNTINPVASKIADHLTKKGTA